MVCVCVGGGGGASCIFDIISISIQYRYRYECGQHAAPAVVWPTLHAAGEDVVWSFAQCMRMRDPSSLTRFCVELWAIAFVVPTASAFVHLPSFNLGSSQPPLPPFPPPSLHRRRSASTRPAFRTAMGVSASLRGRLQPARKVLDDRPHMTRPTENSDTARNPKHSGLSSQALHIEVGKY